jgi:endonuclease-3
VRAILDALAERYPEAQTALRHQTPFQLLVATILSAQCTDARVNEVTRDLFRNHPDLEAFLKLRSRSLESAIRTCGLYRTKAKNILAATRMIADEYGGKVPATREGLMRLPGVGRKTANVILSSAFGQEALAVDTHVFRVSRRIGLARGATPRAVEEDLMEAVPSSEWAATHHRLIFHGRRVCVAGRPRCEICPLHRWCDWYREHGAPASSPAGR